MARSLSGIGQRLERSGLGPVKSALTAQAGRLACSRRDMDHRLPQTSDTSNAPSPAQSALRPGAQPEGRGAAHRGAVEQARRRRATNRRTPGSSTSSGTCRGIIDRALTPRIADARIGELATLEVTVTEHRPGGPRRGARAPYRVLVDDDSGALELVYFNADPAYLKRLLPEGSRRLISGKLEAYDGWLQMPHPDHVVAVDDTKGGTAKLPLLEPIYPLTAGLTNTSLRKSIAEALHATAGFARMDRQGLARAECLAELCRRAARACMRRESAADLETAAPARMRLAYDELLANQLALAVIRQRMRTQRGTSPHLSGKLRQAILSKLPFKLTGAQARVLRRDRRRSRQPLPHAAPAARRCRQRQDGGGAARHGDRGRGWRAGRVDGADRASGAPASQDHRAASPRPAGLRVALLTGREQGRERRRSLPRLPRAASTFSSAPTRLFQEPVEFRDLALVVIDEQHRFGVHQRLALQAKGTGSGAELLVMTATPIPRTLLLTSYGDMDVSRLDEKPPGRKPVTTSVMPIERLDEVVDGRRTCRSPRARRSIGSARSSPNPRCWTWPPQRSATPRSRSASATKSAWCTAGSQARRRTASWRPLPQASSPFWCRPR